jgi:23S rRNA (guanine2445-N2)-methyltransferase / 23S rRNA (guanine2069-N7)-methyltransferase
MCGSGTLLIEASLMWGNIAPGLERDYFGFMSWKGHDIKLWESLVLEAGNIKRESINRPWPRIIGYDSSRSAINLALDNVKNSGLDGIIHLERKELANLNNPLSKDSQSRGSKGFLVVNPPYGERIGSLDEVRCLYRCLGRKMKDEFQGWRTGVFTNHVELADAMGMPSETKHRLYNGPLVCSLYVSDVPPAAKKQVILQQQAPRKYPHNADAFANRLKKNFNHLSKWAARESVSCFRIYDADIPEYNIAVDLYEQFVHVQEYAPPDTIDPDKARERFKNSLLAIREVLGIHGRQIFIKVRRSQKDGVHYQKKEGKGKIIEVNEKNCRFLLNMTDYIDTGLFLDQRITRSIIQEKAKGKRFLNLFAYTGTATVHAAMGGAKTTTSVDSSQAYISWAKSNLALNGFSSENHKFIKSECMKWLLDTREQFDLIFVDPPTFSNSRSRKNTFDVQSDHVTLIRHAMRRLDSGGLLIFSSNFRKFKLDANALSEFILKDISLATIPRDFERNKLIHRCWLIQRKN